MKPHSGVVALAIFLLSCTNPATACESRAILDRLWRSSFSEVEGATQPGQDLVDLAHLTYHASILGAISGDAPDLSYLGSLPGNGLRSKLERWREWYARSFDQLCSPQNDAQGKPTGGCVGQARLLSVWLENERELQRLLRDLELSRQVPTPGLTDVLLFFSTVTGIPAPAPTGPTPSVSEQIDIMAFRDKSKDWIVSHLGGLCEGK